MRIGGIYQANALIGSYLVSAAFFLAHYSPRPPDGLLLQHHRRRRRTTP